MKPVKVPNGKSAELKARVIVDIRERGKLIYATGYKITVVPSKDGVNYYHQMAITKRMIIIPGKALQIIGAVSE